MELVVGLIIIAIVVCAVIHGSQAASPTYIGDVGEARVSNRLKKLNADEYLVFNDIIVLDSEGVTTQIDHVVVSAYGVFVIETKCYKGWIFGDEKSRVWTQTLYGGSRWWSSSEKHTFQNPIRQNWRHIYVLSERLKIPPRYFYNVVVFAGDAEFRTALPGNIMYAADVVPYIRSFTNPIMSNKKRDQIAFNVAILAACVSKEQRACHVDMLYKVHMETRSEQKSASVPRCPKCGATMRLRYRRKDDAPFYGCSRYPKCKGVVNADS